eukprot:SAG11_NODE_103_length_16571_cov_49.569208_19_plen_228_part_00
MHGPFALAAGAALCLFLLLVQLQSLGSYTAVAAAAPSARQITDEQHDTLLHAEHARFLLAACPPGADCAALALALGRAAKLLARLGTAEGATRAECFWFNGSNERTNRLLRAEFGLGEPWCAEAEGEECAAAARPIALKMYAGGAELRHLRRELPADSAVSSLQRTTPPHPPCPLSARPRRWQHDAAPPPSPRVGASQLQAAAELMAPKQLVSLLMGAPVPGYYFFF